LNLNNESIFKKTQVLYGIFVLFHNYDNDLSGYLEFDELRVLLPKFFKEIKNQNLSDIDVLNLIYNTNKEGEIGFKELVEMLDLFKN
jgi:Ca2+-binding EF-hand superfamily protein